MTISVFYDGKCGLCRREIDYYKRIAVSGVFEWVDITVTPEPFTALGFHVSEGLRALHVRDAQKKIHVGIDAFIVIWQAMRYWKLLAVFVRLPVVYPLACFLYHHFAAWRFKRLGYDQCVL